MVGVASSKGVVLYAPLDGFVSFFNSPYSPHIGFAAVDVYTGSRRFGSEAPSPVRGRVRRVFAFEPPSSTWFDAPKVEHMLLVECADNKEVWAKILHIQPSVKEGDKVDVGSPLGHYIRDGYFHPWTDPHMHVELRSCSDPLRARGGYPLKPLHTNQLRIDGALDRKEGYNGIVAKLGERYALVKLQAPFAYLEPFFGLAAQVGCGIGLVDGGVPHYQWAGVLGVESGNISADVKILGASIGTVQCLSRGAALLTCEAADVFVEGLRCVGLSCYLSLKREKCVKVILPTSASLKIGQRVNLELRRGKEQLTTRLNEAFQGLIEHDIYSRSLLRDRREKIAQSLRSLQE
ncbi:MAG: hypothetical protein QXY08_06180 [Nitrososphaerales archaeon]